MQRHDHAARDEAARRVRGAWRVHACAAAMAVGTQVFLAGVGAGMPLCLNAAWLAALASLPAAALTAAICRRALRRDLCKTGAAARVLHMLLCMAFLMCAVFAVVALVSLAEHSLLPQTRAAHSVAMTLAAVFLCALSGEAGAPRLAFLLRAMLPVLLAVLCGVSLPAGEVQGLFPLLGAGAGPLALGTACMLGAAFPVLALLYPPKELLRHDRDGNDSLPDTGFFVWRVLLGAAAGTALLFALVSGSTYERIAAGNSWGERLKIISSSRPRAGIAQMGLTMAQMMAMLLLAVNMLLCARRALGYAFAALEGKTGITVCMVVISAASAALFFAGSDAAQAAVPLLGAALVIALLSIWILIKKEDVHGA